jgi:rubredoxin
MISIPRRITQRTFLVHEGITMDKWRCIACGYIYDPEKGDEDGGIAPGTSFDDLPDDWQCPVCGVGKDMFEKI